MEERYDGKTIQEWIELADNKRYDGKSFEEWIALASNKDDEVKDIPFSLYEEISGDATERISWAWLNANNAYAKQNNTGWTIENDEERVGAYYYWGEPDYYRFTIGGSNAPYVDEDDDVYLDEVARVPELESSNESYSS